MSDHKDAVVIRATKESHPYTSVTIEDKGFSSSETTIESEPQAEGETFAAGRQTRYYKPCEKYEGLHRWDANAGWTEKEEKRIVRKVRQDW